MLEADGLSRAYGRRHALAGVSLRVSPGETVALLGANGAGKSTLLAILAGVLEADEGRAEVAGLRLPGDARRLGEVVGYVPQGESLYPELTVEENVRFFARAHGVPRGQARARAASLLARVRLTARARTRAGDLSGGLRQRAAIAASLAHEPQVLLLDEPGAGLDPASREDLAALVREWRGLGRVVLTATHDLHEASLADRVVFLREGRVVREVPGAEAATLTPLFRAREASS